jgi:hypothetical protein
MHKEVGASGQLMKTYPTNIPKKLLWALFGFFIFTRLIIIYFYPTYISDIDTYYGWAASMAFHQSAYQNFAFPYPPLALPLIYLPIELGSFPWADYRLFFQIEMFLIECTVFYFLIRYAALVLKLDARQVARVAVIYSLLGLVTGLTLYDRIDIVVSLFFVLIIYSYSYWKNNWRLLYLFGTLGALTKIVPGLLLIATAIIRSAARGNISVKNTLLEIAKATAFIVVFLGIYDICTGGGLIMSLLAHGRRGIQVESVWATPLFLKHVLFNDKSIAVTNNFGAHHLTGSGVATGYVTISKYFGCMVFGAMMTWLWACLARTKENKHFTPHLFLLTCFTIFLTFIGTQRVLSSQFLIWLMPGVSLWCVLRPNWKVELGFVALFVLTNLLFFNYWQFIAFKPQIVYISVTRNIIILSLCGYFLWLWATSLRTYFSRSTIASVAISKPYLSFPRRRESIH